MKFDDLTNQPCVLPKKDAQSCVTERLPFQEGRLELRPEVAAVGILGTVQYRTFLIANGVEMEVTSGLTYRSGSQAIALIGAIGGNATGVAEGIVTMSVEWQGLEAFAQLQVVVSCENVSNALMVVIDTSSSMSQAFGSTFGTKLDFAKFLAKQFAGEVDTRKDTVGLVTFGISAQVVAPLTSDKLAVGTAIMGVGFVAEHTDITAGLETAIAALAESAASRKVILLITDGQHNDDAEPMQTAFQFRSRGGVIIAVGLRDGAEAFMRLEQIANGGFFISAFDDVTAEDAKGYVSGLKGYLCAGNCCPDGDRFLGSGKLNFTGWLNWTVTGVVDLIGNGFYDFLPGHGLYVDLAGSSAPWQGGLTSKKTFTFVNARQYKLTYKLAGNQRIDLSGYRVRVIVGNRVNKLVTMDDWRQDFTTFQETFTGDGSTGRIVFLLEGVPAARTAEAFGILLDGVQLDDITTPTMLFMDTFDSENLLYVPPKCGPGTVYGQGEGGRGYAFGYCCYGQGCLTEPVKPQHPDPNPPADVEVTGDPFFVSTQTYTASCPVGTTGADVTREATYKSFISAADANARALALARAMAEAALNCTAPPVTGELINLHAITQFQGLSPFTSPKKGFAAVGITSDDFWNALSYDSVLRKSDGLPSNVTLRRAKDSNFQFSEEAPLLRSVSLDHPDAMYKLGTSFHRMIDPFDAKPEGLFFQGLDPGTYEVYMYGHGGQSELQGAKFIVKTGILTGDFLTGFVFTLPGDVFASGGNTSVIAPPAAGNYLETAWAEGVQFNKAVAIVAPGQSGILVDVIGLNPGTALALSVLMGVQIHRIS